MTDRWVSSHWAGRRGGYGTLDERGLGATVDAVASTVLQAVACPRRGVLASWVESVLIAHRAGLSFTQDALRQLYTLEFLLRHGVVRGRVVLIGDGFGYLAGLIGLRCRDTSLVLIDLDSQLEVQRETLGRLELLGRAMLVRADESPDLSFERVDLAINIASMQEMNATTVATYFRLLRRWRTQYFYCCNRERKEMPGGEVSAFASYPWQADDEHIVDEPCPWHQWRFGIRPPFRRRYDGVHLHRLTRLASYRRAVT